MLYLAEIMFLLQVNQLKFKYKRERREITYECRDVYYFRRYKGRKFELRKAISSRAKVRKLPSIDLELILLAIKLPTS